MSPRFLKTTIPVANQDKVDRLKEQLGRELEDHEIDLSYAEIIIDLTEVEAVRQSYKDEDPVEGEAVVYMLGEPFYCQTPYDEVLGRWLAVKSGEIDGKALSGDVGHAIKTIALALDENGKSNPVFLGWRNHIKNIIVEQLRGDYSKGAASDHLNARAGLAAEKFLILLIESTK